jgi:hypothetical protein
VKKVLKKAIIEKAERNTLCSPIITMNMNSPYQPLADIIDVLLRKNRSSDNDRIKVHIAEISSLPQNSMGCREFEDFIAKLNTKGIAVQIVRQTGAYYETEKIDQETEDALLSEKRSLLGVESPSNSASELLSLTGQQITFKDAEAQIVVGSVTCQLPPFKNEHYFCRVMFSQPVGKPIDWSDVYEKLSGIKGTPETLGNKTDKRTVQDTMYAVNNRIKDTFHTDDSLFTWEQLTIKRNF